MEKHIILVEKPNELAHEIFILVVNICESFQD